MKQKGQAIWREYYLKYVTSNRVLFVKNRPVQPFLHLHSVTFPLLI